MLGRRRRRRQLIVARVATGLAIGGEEDRGEVLAPGGVEVHHQEREVHADVDPAQPGIELDRVDDLHPWSEDEVLGAQVPVSVAHPAGRRAAVQLLPASREEGHREPRRANEARLRGGVVAQQRAEGSEVVVDGSLHGLGARPVAGDVAAGMEVGKVAADGPDQIPRGAPRSSAAASVRCSSKRRISTVYSIAAGSSSGARATTSPSGTTARTPR